VFSQGKTQGKALGIDKKLSRGGEKRAHRGENGEGKRGMKRKILG